jgi:hypothetical protein
MQTLRRELRVPAVAGGLAVLGGVTVRQLGIEFERAWIRSYDVPLLGDPSPAACLAGLQRTHSDLAPTTAGERRRWITNHHPRGAPRAARTTGPGYGRGSNRVASQGS